jgi:hypothetical protein
LASTRVALANSAGGARGAAGFLEQAGERKMIEKNKRLRARPATRERRAVFGAGKFFCECFDLFMMAASLSSF